MKNINKVKIIVLLVIGICLSATIGVTYSRYQLSINKTGSILVPATGYCMNNNLSLADCMLVMDENVKNIDEAKRVIEAKTSNVDTAPSFSIVEPVLVYATKTVDNYTLKSSTIMYYSTEKPTINNGSTNTKGNYYWNTNSTTSGTLKEIYAALKNDTENTVYYTCNSAYVNCNSNNYYAIKKENLSDKVTEEGTITITYGLSNVERNYSYAVDTSSENPGLFSTADLNSTTSYYYRGNVTNNYVKFGKEGSNDICWRIVRLNGDGSVRLIYSGVANSSGVCNATGSNTSIKRYATSTRSAQFNTFRDDPSYVGYMYSLSGQKYMETSPTSYLTYTNIEATISYYFYQDVECSESSKDCTLSGSYIAGVWGDIYDSVINGKYILVNNNLYSLVDGEYVIDENGMYVLLDNSTYALIDGNRYTKTEVSGKDIYNVSAAGNYVKTKPFHNTCWTSTPSGTTCGVYSEVKGKPTSNTQARVIYKGYLSDSVDSIRENTTNSEIKNIVDYWYKNSFCVEDGARNCTSVDSHGKAYSEYLTDSVFCNDRSVYSGYSPELGKSITHTTSGITSDDLNKTISTLQQTTIFWTYRRLVNTRTPSLLCSTDVDTSATKKKDLFTVNDTINGNGDLTYPVGLLNEDEAALAGGVNGQYNSRFYLYTGQVYWTLSPLHFSQYSGFSSSWYVYSTGNLTADTSHFAYGARPVINLSSDVLVVGGTGTQSDPYTVSLDVSLPE